MSTVFRDVTVPFRSRRTLTESAILKARGLLQHHFWGDYVATIVLAFTSASEAAQAQREVFKDWEISKKNPSAIRFHGGGKELDAVEALLVKFGADAKKLKSMAKSIDYGEEFTVSVPVGFTSNTPATAGPQPTQTSLAFD